MEYPRKNLNQYAAVYADYLVKSKQYEEAIPYFKTAIKSEKSKLPAYPYEIPAGTNLCCAGTGRPCL